MPGPCATWSMAWIRWRIARCHGNENFPLLSNGIEHFLKFAVGCLRKTAVSRPSLVRFWPFFLQIKLEKERLLSKNVHIFALSRSVKVLQAVEYVQTSNNWNSPICCSISLNFFENVDKYFGIRHAENRYSVVNRYCARGRSLTDGMLKTERKSKFDGIFVYFNLA